MEIIGVKSAKSEIQNLLVRLEKRLDTVKENMMNVVIMIDIIKTKAQRLSVGTDNRA